MDGVRACVSMCVWVKLNQYNFIEISHQPHAQTFPILHLHVCNILYRKVLWCMQRATRKCPAKLLNKTWIAYMPTIPKSIEMWMSSCVCVCAFGIISDSCLHWMKIKTQPNNTDLWFISIFSPFSRSIKSIQFSQAIRRGSPIVCDGDKFYELLLFCSKVQSNAARNALFVW